MIATRRAVLAGAGAGLIAGPLSAQDRNALPLALNGAWRQGGYALGRTAPGALVFVDGEALTTASAAGLFVIGFDRDAGPGARIEVRSADGARSARRALDIAPYAFPSTSVNGLPPSTVEPSDPALLARIQREIALKTEGFASRIDADDFKDGFVWPLDSYRVSSAWGAQRILNGTPARPHYGIDLAAPQGSVIRAPRRRPHRLRPPRHAFRGRPDPDRPRPGADHLLSAPVAAGRAAGPARAARRSAGPRRHDRPRDGPHLCWRMKWRDRNLDPSLMVGAQAPKTLA